MKYNDTIEILKTIEKAINDPMFIADKLRKSDIFNFPNRINLNNIYEESEDKYKKYDESVPATDAKSSTDSTSHNSNDIICHDRQKDTSSNPQGVLDSITQELTSVRLQQAIILSEIVGKPKSKTRKRRRF